MIAEIPFSGRFHYSRAELIADGIVHAVGIVLAISAGSILLAFSIFHTGPWEYVAAVFYVVALLTVLSISCAYNLWPVSRAKWVLRRFDHAAIYLLIAGTYTPFLAQIETARRRARCWPWYGARRQSASRSSSSSPAASTGLPLSSIWRSAGAAW